MIPAASVPSSPTFLAPCNWSPPAAAPFLLASAPAAPPAALLASAPAAPLAALFASAPAAAAFGSSPFLRKPN